MKYIADKVYVSPDETPVMIRKKVAQRLGVSVTGLRLTILSRQWRKDQEGGLIELTVEAETNEFIHNTTFFPPDLDFNRWMKVSLKNPPVVVGFGVRGAIAAYLLSRIGLKPIVLEAGLPLQDRENVFNKNIRYFEGEGGLSAYSGLMFSLPNLNLTLRSMLKEEGISFDGLDAYQYLPPAFIKSFVAKIHGILVSKGCEVRFGCKYLETKRFLGKVRGVFYEQKGERKFIHTERILFCNGQNDDEFFVGHCLESSSKEFNQFIYGKPLIDDKYPSYFASSLLHVKEQRECLLETGLIKATLMDARLQGLHGQIFEFGGKGKNALSYLGVSVDRAEAEHLINSNYPSGKQSPIPYCTVSDLLFHREPLKLGEVKPTNTTNIQLASMNRLLGDSLSSELEKALRQFGKSFPYLLQEDTLVGGVVCLHGKKGAEKVNISAKEEFFVAVAAAKSLDFSFVCNAAYQAVSFLMHTCKSN